MSVTCIAHISADELCGVVAAGRCSYGQEPLCTSHLGPPGWNGMYRCGACVARAADEARQAQESVAQAKDDAVHELRTTVEGMRRDGLGQHLARRQVRVGQRKTLFHGYQTVYEDLPSAWSIGECLWHVVDGSKDGETKRLRSVATGVTWEGEVVPMEPEGASTFGLSYTTYVQTNPVEVLAALRAVADRLRG